jgi:hypothetical protein
MSATQRPAAQMLPGLQWPLAQASPSFAAGVHLPHGPKSVSQPYDAHWVPNVQGSPSARVPTVAHAGSSKRLTASQAKVRQVSAHAATASGVREEPGENSMSGQSRPLSGADVSPHAGPIHSKVRLA